MKMRARFLATCATSALAIGLGLTAPAWAADMATKAPVIVATPIGWWYEGFAEVGGRFGNSDSKNLGAFYEYRDLRPGVFGNFFVGAHRTGPDPLNIEAWAEDIGWNDQAYGLDINNPGTYYLTAGWDETPHVWSRNAKTLYTGIGSDTLLIPDGVRQQLNRSIVGGLPTANSNAIIVGNSQTINLQIERDTANAAARWTPTDNWDWNADYSWTHRKGVEGLGAVSFSPAAAATSATRSAFELPRPIDDTTNNAGLSGEYIGSTPWDTQYNVRVAGGYSNYNNSFNGLLFQNPWNVSTVSPALQGLRPVNNLYALPPDNQAGSINVTGGVGLPFHSRYMGTFQYTKLSADASNLPFTINPFVTVPPAFTEFGRNASTTLWNNVLTTQITPTLQSALKYRYYNYNPSGGPAQIAGDRPPNPDSQLGFPDEEGAIRFPVNFTKQNADAELVWRGWRWLNLGVAYDWEHWSRWVRQVQTTNENTIKGFLDSKWGFSSFKGSISYGERRFDDYIDPLPTFLQDPTINTVGFRMMDLANRNRWKGQFWWAVDVTRDLTVTPNGGFRNDDYQTNITFIPPGSEFGLQTDHSWNVGVDLSYNISRTWALFLSYNYENGFRELFENTPAPKADVSTTDINNTFIVGSKLTIIPEKLFLDVNYTYAWAASEWGNIGCTPAGCQYGPPTASFPVIHNNLNRLDAQAKYVLDDSWLRGWGFAGTKAYVKARVLWEKNTNDSWQSLQNQAGLLIFPTNAGMAYSIWMATGNPNYDVVLGQVSFGVTW